MDLSQVISGIASQMRVDRELILAQIPHSGEKGSQLEESLRDFLSKYLPKKYEVGTGHVVAPEEYIGNEEYDQAYSHQLDVVVFDHLNFAPLLNAPGYKIYPLQGVKVAIEVKATIRDSNLSNAVDNIRSVKELCWPSGPARDHYVVGGIFAYNTSYTGEVENLSVMHNVVYRIDNYLRNQKIYEEWQAIDLVCILDKGFAIRLGHDWYVYPINEIEPLVPLWYWLHLTLNTGLEDYLDLKIPKFLWRPLEGRGKFRERS